MLDCYTKHQMLGQAFPPQQILLPTNQPPRCFQEEKTTKKSKPPLEHWSHLQPLHVSGSQQLTNLQLDSMKGHFCQSSQTFASGGELNTKHFLSQKSAPEEQEQPGHHPLQDPSDQPLLRGKTEPKGKT